MGPGIWVQLDGSGNMGPILWVQCLHGSGHMGLGIWVQSYGSRHMGLPNVQPDFDAPCFIGPGTQDPGPELQDPGPKSQDPNPSKRICSNVLTFFYVFDFHLIFIKKNPGN